MVERLKYWPHIGSVFFYTGPSNLTLCPSQDATREVTAQAELQSAALPAYNLDMCRNVYRLDYESAPRGCAGGARVGLCGTVSPPRLAGPWPA